LPQADFSGAITQVIPANGDGKSRQLGWLAMVWVEAGAAEANRFGKATVVITTKTDLARLVGGSRKSCRWDELKAGSKVQVVFTGPVRQAPGGTGPAMGTAKQLLVLEGLG
jgi:hypothetical protein